MARKLRHSRLETRTARLKLAIRKKPYTGPSLALGGTLLYRRNKGNGLAGEPEDYSEFDPPHCYAAIRKTA